MDVEIVIVRMSEIARKNPDFGRPVKAGADNFCGLTR